MAGLVFRVCDIGYTSGPAGSAALALVVLVLRGAGLHLSRHRRRPRPPGRVFTVDHMA